MINTEILKSAIFEVELSYIKDERLKENARILLDLLPDYYYEIPASSSGKYHPDFATGNKGLIRHTKVAVRIAKEILDLELTNEEFTANEKDLILITLLLHDGVKSGYEHSEHTKFEHPIIIAEFILNNKDKTTLTDEEIQLIVSSIKTHMGEWTTSAYSDIVLPKPEDKNQKLVHVCDYLSSRKFLSVKFDKDDNIDG